MIKWILGAIVGVILGIATYFSLYLGAFKPVVLAEKTEGPLTLIYKVHIGAYHKIVPTLDEVQAWVESQKLVCQRTFGEFLDDPRVNEEGRLRANVGCVIENSTANLPVPLPTLYPEGFKHDVRPAKKYVTAVFEGSPAIGPSKVYPKVEEYFEAKNSKQAGPAIEIYEIHSQKAMTTTYLFPME
jgi:AraC family transcriptional regulator